MHKYKKNYFGKQVLPPACTSNRLIQTRRPVHGRALCANVAIASQKTPRLIL